MNAFEILARAGALGIRLHVEGDQLRYEAPNENALTPALIEDLRRNRAEIIRFLRAARSVRERPPVLPVPDDAPCPLSSAQQRFYFLDKLEGPSSSYNLSSAFVLEGALDVAALRASIREIVRRHQILRTRFVSSADGLIQIVTDWSPEWRFIDLSGLPQERRWPVFETIPKRESVRPFNVADGPHMRAGLVRIASDVHVFLVDLHHIVSDGGSIDPFVRDLHACYDLYRRGQTPALAPLPVQYRDFAHWQRSNASLMSGQLEYWREKLAGAPALVQLPLDRPRPAQQTFCGDTVRAPLGADLEGKLERLRGRHGFTPFHCLLGALVVLLNKYSRQDDIVIGTPVSNRPHKNVEALIGPFLNMIAVRTQLSGDLPLRDVLERIRQAMIESLDHADVPFEDVVAALQPERSSSYSPLFNVMFVLEDTPVGILELPGLKTTTLNVKTESAKYDLTLVVQRDSAGLNCWFKYNSDLFDRETIARMAAHYLNVLAAIADNLEGTLDGLCVLSPGERQEQLFTWNDTALEFPLHRCTHQFFEERAQKHPAIIALDFEDHTLTYAETNAKANQLAHFLIAQGVGPESI
ncbi:MAG TPA: condensation domain-containing protein, partial [Bryobacteraceae bacterium]